MRGYLHRLRPTRVAMVTEGPTEHERAVVGTAGRTALLARTRPRCEAPTCSASLDDRLVSTRACAASRNQG